MGCGRVIRHFEEVATPNLWGVDIDSDNVEWCNANLKSRSYVAALSPPTQLASNSCNLIYSCSVLSHLTEKATVMWLEEMHRLLTADGVALLSFNGSSNAATYLSRRPREFSAMLESGFHDRDVNHDLDGYIGSNEYYRATFCSDDWWLRTFSEHFTLVTVENAVVNGHQDIAVLRKRSSSNSRIPEGHLKLPRPFSGHELGSGGGKEVI